MPSWIHPHASCILYVCARRSLKPGVHYVPYWDANSTTQPDDILSVVDQLEQIDRADPAALQRVVSNAMSFAAK